jgi:hypothetical protein
LVYRSVTSEDVSTALDFTEELWLRTYALNVTKVVGVVPASEDLPSERTAFTHDNLLFDEQRQHIGTIEDLVGQSLRDRRVFEEFQQRGDQSHRFFVVEIGMPRSPAGTNLFVEKLEPRRLRQLDELTITGRCRVAKSRVAMQHGTIGAVRVAWGATTLEDRKAMVVALHREGSDPSLTLHLSEPEIEATEAGTDLARDVLATEGDAARAAEDSEG